MRWKCERRLGKVVGIGPEYNWSQTRECDCRGEIVNSHYAHLSAIDCEVALPATAATANVPASPLPSWAESKPRLLMLLQLLGKSWRVSAIDKLPLAHPFDFRYQESEGLSTIAVYTSWVCFPRICIEGLLCWPSDLGKSDYSITTRLFGK